MVNTPSSLFHDCIDGKLTVMPEMKLAYVITAHTNARQMVRLLGAIESPRVAVVVIHIDAKAEPEVHTAARQWAETHGNIRVLPSQKIIWGSWRLAQAQILGVREALGASGEWDYCLNLTGQDYPLKTQDQIASALAGGPVGANYLEVLDFAQASENPRKRLEYYWIHFGGRMRKFLPRRAPGFHVYWGSNYFALTRAACEHLVGSDISLRMQRVFRFTPCADEMIFQNALMHGPAGLRDSIIGKTHRKLTWDGELHPRIYTLADRDELLASDAWFARKFDQDVDSAILDALDEHLASG